MSFTLVARTEIYVADIRKNCRIGAQSLIINIPYSGKFSNGANFRIIQKHAICAKIKIFEILFWPRTRMQVGMA